MDAIIDARLKASKDSASRRGSRASRAKIAIANGKLAYQRYQGIFGTERWKKLAAKGAQTQRVLWASTSTKNPAYSDVMYVEELIGPDTVNTMPPDTLEAFRDHGHPRQSLTEDIARRRKTMKTRGPGRHLD